MTVYYEHPQHGFHVLTYGDDVKALEAAGWFRSVSPTERRNASSQATPTAPKRGRKPKAEA